MKLPHSSRVQTLVLLATLLAPMITWAQAPAKNPPETHEGKGQSQGPRREPPPQAYEKCKGKKDGDKVQINTPREGNIGAVCVNSPKGLFARPDRPPHERPDGGEASPPRK
ncbi:hypothetical protein ACO0LB_03805 [Undibacterium sp. SXout7W]|uniref:hypothetical protein n=1 Tax=Undibacterium sp. SXout7W TaxID=3413049 RepID=UPI003BF407AB